MLKISIIIMALILTLHENGIAESKKPKLINKEFNTLHGREIASAPGESQVLLSPNSKNVLEFPKAKDFNFKQENNSVGFRIFEK